jgi:hypothetical protein
MQRKKEKETKQRLGRSESLAQMGARRVRSLQPIRPAPNRFEWVANRTAEGPVDMAEPAAIAKAMSCDLKRGELHIAVEGEHGSATLTWASLAARVPLAAATRR